MSSLPFRQVHLDFHTSGRIPGVGSRFDKEEFQQALETGYVNSITLFSKCHHGYSYHPTTVGEMHPHLTFDLLQAQIDACEEIGIATRIYISAGVDERVAVSHPEWLARNSDETLVGNKDFISGAGFHVLCYNTSYLDLLLTQTKEVIERYSPKALFFDISSVKPCYCARCRADILARGKDIRDFNAVLEQADIVYKKYAAELEGLIHSYNPNTEIFHNSGHLTRGRRDLAHCNTHLELESLPTGGWGYDHLPMSASYAVTLGMDYLGMTGKFNASWGEFGGYKHPNALKYEMSLLLAFGAKCSIGDQLHPFGKPDMSTYELIGKAYKEVKDKEVWCDNAENIADVAIISQEAVNSTISDLTVKQFGDIGANRMMLEGKYLYNIIDPLADLAKYKVVILPDNIRIDEALEEKLNSYLMAGGKILATGSSGLKQDEDVFAVDLGIKYIGKNKYKPNYIRPDFETTNNGSLFVMYTDGYEIEPICARTLAHKQNPFFNRDIDSFCSHYHTPSDLDDAGTAIAVTENTAYIAWEVFSDYSKNGSLHLKEIVLYLLDGLLGEHKTVSTNLPDRAVMTLTRQQEHNRYINHILFAHTTKRGDDIEVIESIVPLYGTEVKLRLDKKIKRAYLAPGLQKVPFIQENDAIVYKVPEIHCHQIIVMEYEAEV